MTPQFTLFIILIFCSGFFSGSETVLFSLSRIQIQRFRSSKNHGAHMVVECIRQPRKWLATILLGNELVNVSISIIGAAIVNHFLVYDIKIQTLIAVVIITPIILFFGEIIPKNLAIRFSSQLAPIVIYPLSLFYRIVKPFRFVLSTVADKFVILFGGHPEKIEPMIMEEEFRRLVDLGRREGVIVEEEREMIHKVFEFTDKTVADIMTPAGQIFALPMDYPYDRMLSEIKATQFSRIPIFENELKNIVGILHVRDLFAFHRKRETGGEQDIRSILHKPLFVSSNKKLEELLRDFQKSRKHLALIKEGEEFQGLVTMDDVLEEIFGEMER